MPLELYRFRYFDTLRQRWVEARYRATLVDIRSWYERFEVVGEPWTPNAIGKASNIFGRGR